MNVVAILANLLPDLVSNRTFVKAHFEKSNQCFWGFCFSRKFDEKACIVLTLLRDE